MSNMIKRVYTSKRMAILATSTPQFKLIAILLIVKQFKKISLLKLQLYLWGLQQEENLQTILDWKVNKRITNLQWLDDETVTPIVFQCLANHLLEMKVKNKKGMLELAWKSDEFLSQVDNLDIIEEINLVIEKIGKVTDTLLKNIEFNF